MKADVRDLVRAEQEVVSRLQPMAESAAHAARQAARFVRDKAREAPSGDEVLHSLGLERRRSVWQRVVSVPFLVAVIVGGAIVFFLDRDNGRRRRALARDRAYGLARDAGRIFGRGSRFVGAQASGVTRKVTRMQREEEVTPSDAVLVDRVKSEAFRGIDPDLKGRVSINAVDGLVFLRGEVEQSEDIRALEERVRRVPGVSGVENLLHVSGTPAPGTPAGTPR